MLHDTSLSRIQYELNVCLRIILRNIFIMKVVFHYAISQDLRTYKSMYLKIYSLKNHLQKLSHNTYNNAVSDTKILFYTI